MSDLFTWSTHWRSGCRCRHALRLAHERGKVEIQSIPIEAFIQKLRGESGDGIGALGFKELEGGLFELVSVETVVKDEPPFLRKAGMGGARYLRHCLESVVLERGGLWMPEIVATAMDMLEKLDGGTIGKARFETWLYAERNGDLSRVSTRDSNALPHCAKQPRKFIEKDIHWDALFGQIAASSADQLERKSLRDLWIDRYDGTIGRYLKGEGDDGLLLTALLARQAVLEREFIGRTAETGAFDESGFLSLIALRYVRTLCQFSLSEADQSFDSPLAPDPTEVGRTILLLASAGRAPEAMELGARLAPYIDAETLFVPTVPRFAIAFASDRDDLLTVKEQAFGTTLQEDCRDVLAYLRGQSQDDVAQSIDQIIDARRRQMGSFSDEYHIDFDDELSMAMPYEATAIRALCSFMRRPVPDASHPALSLPIAQPPDFRDTKLPYQDIYAAFLSRRA